MTQEVAMWTEWLKRWMEMVFWWLPQEQRPERGGTTAGRDSARRSSTSPGSAGGEAANDAASGAGRPSGPAAAASPAAASGTADEEAGPAAEPPQRAREQAPEASPDAVVVDDLTAIKGIGATMQERLAELGIRSFRELADTDADRLTEQLKARQIVISRERVSGWVSAARERL
ncbi:MAG: DUF4332 domain-containing protein [Arhodomonas sp.]|nr:DUF4332 domain-containing protein [Arhodomonas sp.]